MRQVWLLQRSAGRPGARLNKTTGWVRRATLKNKRVTMLGGVRYDRFDGQGLHITIDGKPEVLPVDNVVVCAGQESNRSLADALAELGHSQVHVIGGADVAAELDAKRAITQATRLASEL
jgi:2,4-dienoyl-CoA reductase (NADPH2)